MFVNKQPRYEILSEDAMATLDKGWKRLVTNSAKMVNILGGYGYQPMLASMEQCVDAAEKGKLA